jgi:phosphohistidine swiveling domain-containing protein
MTHVYCCDQGVPDVSEVGGKAANLGILTALHQTVPKWFAVKASAFLSTMTESGLDRKVNVLLQSTTDKQSEQAGLATIRDWVADVDLSDALREEIIGEYRRSMNGARHVAVRSSAVDEDNPDQSFAGIHDSFLFLSGEEAIIDAIKKVWASAYNERALAYRRENGLTLDEIAVATIVQEMIEPTVSGVMFTVNPVSGNVQELVVSSLYGTGEGLVSEGLDADVFTVTKGEGTIVSEVANKEEMVVLNADAGVGVTKVPVPEARRDESSLSDEQIRLLADTGVLVEKAYGVPQDIEFCFDGTGRLYLLQSRPVTTVEEYGPAAGNHLVWDNSNIIESYSGVTSPMTFSFIRRAYTIVYNCFCDVMGVPQSVIRKNQGTFSNMLGLFRGQVYYNLLNWYRLIRLFPGFDYNKEFMESMMGVKEPVELKGEYTRPGFLAKYFVELPRLLQLVARSAWNFSRIRKLTARFDAHFNTHYERWSQMDFAAKRPDELMSIYHDMEEKLLWQWKPPIINDFFVMIFYGTLKKLCGSWCGDKDGTLQNDLICGEGGIESTQPTKMLIELAGIARRTPGLGELIANEKSADLLVQVQAKDAYAEFNRMFNTYLDRYGFRCMNELKLEEHSLRECPDFVFTVIRNYLQTDDANALDVHAMEQREQGIRREAEKKAFGALDSRLRRSILRWVLRNARLGVKNRENMRFARTKIYGLLRDLLRAMGGHFTKEGLLESPDDIFFLMLDECFDYIKGTAVTTDLAALAALRKKEFAVYREEEDNVPDDRFDTYGMAYNRNRFRSIREDQELPADGVLRGIGCCPGEVTGPVVVFRHPSADMHLAGEILVAERTDPGWVPLYPSASGLLIERGSILSHSAIVAREMGIPTIVGIPGLTSVLETGQEVTMDGARGTVGINAVSNKAEASPTEAA